MSFLKNHAAVLVFIFISLFYGCFFLAKVQKVNSGESTCVCSYDGYGYYMYLPQLFSKGNLNFKPSESQDLQNKYCDSTEVYQLFKMDNGNHVDIYHMGLSYLQLPAFATGHLLAKITGLPQDGFSRPYHIAFLVNTWIFIVLGAYFCMKLFSLFFNKLLTALLLLLLFFGTNYLANTLMAYSLQHHYLLALIAVFSYYLLKSRKQLFQGRYFLLAVVLFGLITSIRPTHALLGIFPLVLMWGQFPSKKVFWSKILLFPFSAFAWNIPQILYWKIAGGSWVIFNLHVEELVVIDPHFFDFLFSFRKGWLIYTPLFLLAVPGLFLLRKNDVKLFRALALTVILFIWVFASWECWWYAYSFGSRVMVDLYPLLFLPIGILIQKYLLKKIQLIVLTLMITVSFVLNGLQSYQYYTGFISGDRMTYDHYRYIFGRMDIPDYDERRLLIDRNNLEWPSQAEEMKDPLFELKKTDLFTLKREIKSPGNEDVLISKLTLLDRLNSDETQLEASIEYSIADNSKSTVLRMETVSKFNAYDWQHTELASGREVNKKLTATLRFNLKDINHRQDKLQIYLDNDTGGQVTVHKMSVEAITLLRK